MSFDNKTKKAMIRFMKTYGFVSVTSKDGTTHSLNSLTSVKDTTKEKVVKEKDPNAPKQPSNPYMRWTNSFSDEQKAKNKVAAENSKMKVPAYLGTLWASLGEEGQKPYKESYEKDRALYLVAKEKYLADKKAAADASTPAKTEEPPKVEPVIVEEEAAEETEETPKEIVPPKKKQTKKTAKKNTK